LESIAPFGDAAILVTLGDQMDLAINRRVHRLAVALERARATEPRFGRAVPGVASLLVPFDPLAMDSTEAEAAVRPLLDALDRSSGAAEEAATRPVISIPVRYGGLDGPDLDEVAARHGLRPTDVVDLHASATYQVFLLGFAPGFGYLGPLPDGIATPRRETPRMRVPAGSVGIADRQTCVYPFATPGGWNLIGRTDVRMWDLGRPEPALLAPGDVVRFFPS
jgi:inhibitor of KinA